LKAELNILQKGDNCNNFWDLICIILARNLIKQFIWWGWNRRYCMSSPFQLIM